MGIRFREMGLVSAMLMGLAMPSWAESSRAAISPGEGLQAAESGRTRSAADGASSNGVRNGAVEKGDVLPYGAGYAQRLRLWLQLNQTFAEQGAAFGSGASGSTKAGDTTGAHGNAESNGSGNGGSGSGTNSAGQSNGSSSGKGR